METPETVAAPPIDRHERATRRVDAMRRRAVALTEIAQTLVAHSRELFGDAGLLDQASDLLLETKAAPENGGVWTPAAERAAAWAAAQERGGVRLLGPFASSSEGLGIEADLTVWKTAPTVCVPKFGVFEPLPESVSAHRFLVSNTGLWLECRRPWLHAILPVAPLAEGREDVRLPYGALEQRVVTAFGKVPHDALRQFAELARAALPNEAGAWMAWETYAADAHGDAAALLEWYQPVRGQRTVLTNGGDGCTVVTGTPGRLDYPRPETTDTSTPCIDLHSHGAAPAFFSPTDDADDRHDVKIAIVLGNLDQSVPSIAARLCVLGVMIPIRVDAEEVFSVQAAA